MIVTTLGRLVEAEPALMRLAQQKMAYAHARQVAQILRAVSVETSFFATKRQELVKAVGVSRPATNEEMARGETTMLEVAPPHMPGFLAEITALASVAVSLDVEPLPAKVFDKVEDISAADLMVLAPFVAAVSQEAP